MSHNRSAYGDQRCRKHHSLAGNQSDQVGNTGAPTTFVILVTERGALSGVLPTHVDSHDGHVVGELSPTDEVPDGSNANIYYGKIHTLDASTSTIPSMYEDLIATGACGYAAVEWSVYAVNRVNVGGTQAAGEFLDWGNRKLKYFRQEINRLGRKNRVRVSSLY